MSKIFGIGLSRTGTHSLVWALRCLGYRACHFPIGMLRYTGGGLSVEMGRFDEYDALADTPIARTYKKLDQMYPESKFILTIRDTESWLKSCERHVGTSLEAAYQSRPSWWMEEQQGSWHAGVKECVLQLHRELYNSVHFDRAQYQDAYLRHLNDVKDYFENRTEDLLILDICGGEGWPKLCAFLDKPLPDEPFPKRASKRGSLRRRLSRALRRLRTYLQKPVEQR